MAAATSLPNRLLIPSSPPLYTVDSRAALTHPPPYAVPAELPSALPVTTAPAEMPVTWFTDGSLVETPTARRAFCAAWCETTVQEIMARLPETKSSTGSNLKINIEG